MDGGTRGLRFLLLVDGVESILFLISLSRPEMLSVLDVDA